MSLLTKDQILEADDLETKDVYVKPWGGHVRIRTMTAHERDQFEQKMFASRSGSKKDRVDNIRAVLVAMAVVDEDGNRLFTDKDVKALAKKSAAAMDRIFAETQKLNAVSNEDVEEMAKNSEETQDELSDGE
jgi:hypothetical protein